KLGAFSPDGRRLVTVSQGDGVFKSDGKQVSEPPMVMLWDAGKRSLVATLAHTDRVNTATFSSDNARLLTASSDGSARLWNAETGSLSATLAGHAGVVTNAVFSANGKRIVTGSRPHRATLGRERPSHQGAGGPHRHRPADRFFAGRVPGRN